MTQCQEMKNQVILDSGSYTSVFYKEEYCDKIEKTTPIEIKMNGASISMNQKCKVPDLGMAYCKEDSLTNIIGLKGMQKKYRVTYDSQVEPPFLIHTEKGIVRFKENEDVIYAINITNKEKQKSKIR